MARFHAPATIFIDEIDALASQRGGAHEHEASRRVKAELLVQMDGVGSETTALHETEKSSNRALRNVMVLAASNFPWDLDEALRRRLEKRIYIAPPTPTDIKALLNINLCSPGVTVDGDVDLEILSQRMQGYSGADITNLCREAAMAPMRRAIKGLSKEQMKALQEGEGALVNHPVMQADLEQALERVNSSVRTGDIERYKLWHCEFGAS